MKSAHVSDLHLGYRAYAAAEGGRNVREIDVEKAWDLVVDQIIEYRPDICTIAGDVFHHPGVSDHAKLAFLQGICRLIETGIRVIVLQGNHDAGKTAAVLTPIMLATPFGKNLDIVTTPKRIRIDDTVYHGGPREPSGQRISVACFPYVARGNGEKYLIEPDPDADVNVLVMHAAVAGDQDGNLPWFYSGGEAVDVTREAEKWDIVHLGDFHEYRLFNCPGRVFYSGSIERTSSDIWKEHAPKGWVSVDTEKPGHEGVEFHEIPTRPMHDWAAGLHPASAAILNQLLALELTEPRVRAIDGAIVRLVVPDFPRHESHQIDRKLEAAIKQRALHFQLDIKYAKSETVLVGGHEMKKGVSIEDALRTFCGTDEELLALIMEHLATEERDLMEVAVA